MEIRLTSRGRACVDMLDPQMEIPRDTLSPHRESLWRNVQFSEEETV